MPGPDQIIADLDDTLADNEDLGDLLVASLTSAGSQAKDNLESKLYDALDWPENLDSYREYLRTFIRWIPRQSSAPAWTVDEPEKRYAKEVSDRLAHFFWLVDQKVHDDGTAIAENSEPFANWLTQFARQWGSFLDTPESFSRDILDSFLEDAPEYTIGESMINGEPNMPSGWLTFNQFFARELNGGLRPITDPGTNGVVSSPADCSFQHAFDIDAQSNIPATRLKETHTYGNIGQLLEGSKYADTFAGGTFVHYMLPPSAYHRFHLPVAGVVEESFVNQGKVFMEVDLEDHQLASKDSATSGYEFTQTHGIVTVDTSASDAGDLGIVGVVPVGMSHVASVVLTATAGKTMAKGEEFGYFQFGGSDIIVLFQAGAEPDIDKSAESRQVGSPIAHVTTRS